LRVAPITDRLRSLSAAPPADARAEAQNPAAAVSAPPLLDWEPTPGGHQSTETATYRLGGDAASGVSSIVTIRFPSFRVGGSLLFTVDVGISIAHALKLGDVAALARDGVVLTAASLPNVLGDLLPSDAVVSQVELHFLAASRDGNSRNRPNELLQRLDLSSLGEPTRPLGESLGFAARVAGPPSDREAAELVVEAINYVALAAGYLDPRLGISALRTELGITP
jgi:hypothetical protein